MFSPCWLNEASKQFTQIRDKALNARKKRKNTKSSKQEGLYKQVDKTLKYLLKNPKHPSLKTHEFHSIQHPYNSGEKVFEAYCQNNTPGAYRILWCYGPDKKQITIIRIIKHPEK